MDEVQLVLPFVGMPAALLAGLEHECVDTERLDTEAAAKLAHEAVPEVVDVTHTRLAHQSSSVLSEPRRLPDDSSAGVTSDRRAARGRQ
jgi:hypothetical protein